MSVVVKLWLRPVAKGVEPAAHSQVIDMAAVDEAQQVWQRTRETLDANIVLLKVSATLGKLRNRVATEGSTAARDAGDQ